MNSSTEWVTCDRCDGSGRVPDHDAGKVVNWQWVTLSDVTCPSCEGKGQVRQDVPKEASND